MTPADDLSTAAILNPSLSDRRLHRSREVRREKRWAKTEALLAGLREDAARAFAELDLRLEETK